MPSLATPLSLPALVASAFFVSLATVAVPGPITLVATRLALSRHLMAAVWFLVGVTSLDVALFAALASGAAPKLRELGAIPFVEVLGGAALLWGGLSSLRSPHPTRDPQVRVHVKEGSPVGHFFLGLLVAAGNPHYWIWWVTAGLAFVEAARAHGASGLLWMLGALVGGVLAWYAPLLWALSRGSVLLTPKIERWVMRCMGVALFLLGVGLVGVGSWRFYVAHFSR
ncbi:MAG: LysE family translocator [Thermoanaerobaculales bacterium]